MKIYTIILILSLSLVESKRHKKSHEPKYSMLPASLSSKDEVLQNVHESVSVVSEEAPPCPEGADCSDNSDSMQVVQTQSVPPCPEGADCDEDAEPQMKVVQTQTRDVPPCPENAECDENAEPETKVVQTETQDVSSSSSPCEDDGDECGEKYIIAKIKSPCEGSDPCEENKIEIVKKLHDDDEDDSDDDEDDDEDQKSLRFARVTDSTTAKSTTSVIALTLILVVSFINTYV